MSEFGVVIGYPYREGCAAPVLGDDPVVRAGTIIYADVVIGDHFQTGHYAIIREHCRFGDHVWIGTHCVIDGHVSMGSFVKVSSHCYIPPKTVIGSRVFIGPGAVLTNDKYPLKMRDAYVPTGPVIEDNATIGAGSVILPGVRVAHGAFVAAGAVVTRNVPTMTMARGNPASCTPLPTKLRENNTALSWRNFLQIVEEDSHD
jgi:acetyltransferase-like isoleucine patch superfamily enzyme